MLALTCSPKMRLCQKINNPKNITYTRVTYFLRSQVKILNILFCVPLVFKSLHLIFNLKSSFYPLTFLIFILFYMDMRIIVDSFPRSIFYALLFLKNSFINRIPITSALASYPFPKKINNANRNGSN